MEYVIVDYEEAREVFIDENTDPGGMTGDVLMVEKGTHRFQLGGAQDYSPAWRQPVVKDTTPASPMEIEFEKD